MIDPLIAGSLENTVHVVQLALTPVFLLSGIATLLNVFGARLARVADQAEKVSGLLAGASDEERRRLGRRLDRLHVRSLALDLAVVLAALGGVAICGAVLTLFVGALRDATVASLLFGLFGAAILCTLCALVAFGFEMMLASRTVRDRIAQRRADAGVAAAE
ncbi:DUF2721 domain-containing protein [Methylobacterium aerolatum]|uniref:DUF2721 domain-containing protein n=1 Tax=Methylobacterium aerolatum TaxID=418708 RepID=A0ABU0HX55_9HYPH|nr:DUF2721 domain-containing protein [Methylobacterium aerolatum]MDQ0446457.1 hypothetical protein [Methylobacterium aerolatum]GJD33380.1 hypothetical protein FMGBMHLM_0267 [Methylobacterium aerolatum]